MPHDMMHSFSLTLRPRDGLKPHHQALILRWLKLNAAQWQCVLQEKDCLKEDCCPGEGDPATTHLHGRVLLKHANRIDNLKRSLVNHMMFELHEKTELQKGIRYLYDDWDTYLHERPHEAPDQFQHITNEDDWIYADPAKKVVKEKNAALKHVHQLLIDTFQLDVEKPVTHKEIDALLKKAWRRDLLEFRTPTQFKNMTEMLTQWHMAGLAN